MKVGVSSQADLQGELAEFASHPLWRNIWEMLVQYADDLKGFAANSDPLQFSYNKGCFHGALNTIAHLQNQLEQYKG